MLLCSAGACVFTALVDPFVRLKCLRMVQGMAPSGEPGGEDLHKRALENHRKETVGFLILAKSILSNDAYKDLIKTSQEIVKRRYASCIKSYFSSLWTVLFICGYVLTSNTVLFYCSSCTEGGITAKKCEEILLGVFAGQTHVLKGFHHFLAGRDPFHDNDSQQSLLVALSFLVKVKVIYTAAPCLRFLLGVAI